MSEWNYVRIGGMYEVEKMYIRVFVKKGKQLPAQTPPEGAINPQPHVWNIKVKKKTDKQTAVRGDKELRRSSKEKEVSPNSIMQKYRQVSLLTSVIIIVKDTRLPYCGDDKEAI
ncbi:hypothetical protein TNCV_1378751 [Trichonephila clavipes]|nr:hypothetical protein TNCV_1378751 [Trichonephila clavipes]